MSVYQIKNTINSQTMPKTPTFPKEGQLQGRNYSIDDLLLIVSNHAISTSSKENQSWATRLQKNFENISSTPAKFGTGASLGLGMAAISSSYQFTASVVGWVPDVRSILIQNFSKMGVNIDRNTKCPFEEIANLVSQLNIAGTAIKDLPDLSIFETLQSTSWILRTIATPYNLLMGVPIQFKKHTPSTLKLAGAGFVFDAAIFEEIIFRGIIQDVLMKRLPQRLLKAIAPGKETLLDTKTAKVFRIVTTAAMFSFVHIANVKLMSDNYVYRLQLPMTFLLGILCGAIKESKLGLTGAIGAHMGFNAVAIATNFTMC